jgi:hypothetical protein
MPGMGRLLLRVDSYLLLTAFGEGYPSIASPTVGIPTVGSRLPERQPRKRQPTLSDSDQTRPTALIQ